VLNALKRLSKKGWVTVSQLAKEPELPNTGSIAKHLRDMSEMGEIKKEVKAIPRKCKRLGSTFTRIVKINYFKAE